MQDLPNGGGRRCKHWPPGAGDPRYATAKGLIQVRATSFILVYLYAVGL